MISKHGVHGDVAYRAAHLMKTVHYDMFNDLFKLNRITLSEKMKRLRKPITCFDCYYFRKSINRAGGVCLEFRNNLSYDECLKGCGCFERLRK